MKKVLIMCTGNSCRSIIAEALINARLDGVLAYSCGVAPSGQVNSNAKRVLLEHNCWDDKYYSKHLDELVDMEFDLVVTVCGHAEQTCPSFSGATRVVHIGFDDPDGLGYEAFEQTYAEIESILLPQIKQILGEEI